MSSVFVVDQQHRPRDPIHPGRARYLLRCGYAAVWRRYPFTLILKPQEPPPSHQFQDAVGGTSGASDPSAPVPQASPMLQAHSLRIKLDPGANITGIALVNDMPLQIEHMTPRSRQGSDRVSNLTLACKPCNQRKGSQTAAEFGFPELAAQAQQPLHDAAAVNSTRWALYHALQAIGLPVEVGTGGRTKWNRTVRGLPKAHWLDAVCVGASTPTVLDVTGVRPLSIIATGRHSRQMCRTNAAGFPDKAPKATSVVAGLRTGDMVRAVVPATSLKAGVHVGRIAIRATGSCNIKTAVGTLQGIHVRFCTPVHRGDGYSYYSYQKGAAALLPPA
jgi:RRXRR protein/HNH endonuclease